MGLAFVERDANRLMLRDDQTNGTTGTRSREADRSAQPSTQAALAPKPAFAVLKPPSLTLPSGGGAIRGIGEVFRANPPTGPAPLTIPPPFPPPPPAPTP